ncbi:MAG TPA: hypothetical protein VFB38_24940 [Chthonomonadaceae bacterium]|nr:hypothetical protein [Chthonomonadaceae bacterium]
MPQTDGKQQAAPTVEIGTLVRAALVLLLALTLVGALRWALNVTNANARQVSTNLTHLQARLGRPANGSRTPVRAHEPVKPDAGPSIEPAEDAPQR